ncbi:F0F1 ATP synthase subunit A [Mesomycoplasma hyorhinis]|uniref:F0F1 ATP synthase subunit A n=1 Tax=Mesomycoplasma hyorhinis (strain MCLD) TaxID=936139 RepID=A0ABM5M4P3_MESHM|nr:F0F1 ATP synthase subunit A [Mesomycoplasma hyorhinis MCLD]AEX14141.1 ATP synthase F0, A subunit [Mesomycoplasma hyorhinis GDL-1]AHA41138.1 ATP synthase, Alfa subunit [Mesomycoplasma hyorhinis DBS 1050]VEU57893.1 F-ATPase subunit 6 [Mesomycoplasma hyorhinis]
MLDTSKFLLNWNQPQLFTMCILIFLVLVLSLVIYFQIKKVKVDKVPPTIVLLAEDYFLFIDNLVEDISEGKLNVMKRYFFTLFTFLAFGNLLSVFGFETIASSLSVTLTLGIISWTGIFVVGFIFNKLAHIKKYIVNPLNALSAPAPLISLSFRLFGNIIGGSAILLVMYHGLSYVWHLIPSNAIGVLNVPAIIIYPPFIFYFDIFGSLVQSFIFTVLTISYWSAEIEEEVKPKKQRKSWRLPFKKANA